jgi:hypothetical protein
LRHASTSQVRRRRSTCRTKSRRTVVRTPKARQFQKRMDLESIAPKSGAQVPKDSLDPWNLDTMRNIQHVSRRCEQESSCPAHVPQKPMHRTGSMRERCLERAKNTLTAFKLSSKVVWWSPRTTHYKGGAQNDS